ncbi:sorting and assembly machinery component 50 homolog B-like [Olea europaea subsp. europaea]|uniref:Sorting and assembly machinery component 50 homolog B-like n=1 Tax=Olea europaea subsp. europaea TaxID=158383 RepID=A0A8S0PMZ3_OLEEU|nr:sorting and assembly machinery component 50 homolog B-like [Olea europaea subsp. europaea]
MAVSSESAPHPGQPENPNPSDPTPEPDDLDDFEAEIEEEDNDESDEGDEETQPITPEAQMRTDRVSMESLFKRLSTERVPVRVHDVLIKGNTKTKDSIIEAEIEELLKNATTVQQLLQAAGVANARLQRLDIFDSVNITLDAGPPELPGTANVVVEVSEAKNPLTGDVGIFSKPEARSWSLEGSLKLKNLFGYGDLWDGSVAYGWGQASEVSAGVSVPKFKALATPLTARISLLSQDWLKFSSYKEQALGMSLGLLSIGNHDLSYNLSWRTLIDPSQMASHSVRRHLGHGLLSALKYTFKIDQRNSPLRPTRGYAFLSTTHIGGLVPDNRSLRFIRQEFDLRYAVPLGFYHAALNFGISGGFIFPWGRGFLNTPSYLPERFFLGGNASPVCTLGGPTSILGFKARGLGPAEPRRQERRNSNNESSYAFTGVDFIGGDLAVTAFADLSFDLPLRVLREAGIHGHAFACTGSLTKLTENAYRELSVQKLRESFRCSAGFGIIVPTKLFRMEVNYCYILKQHEHDQGKTGVQFSFSSL